jgi:APA family basic amino acid/polyamine antiporter
MTTRGSRHLTGRDRSSGCAAEPAAPAERSERGFGSSPSSRRKRRLDGRSALLLVIANMVGTGVFTTLGLQAAGVQDGAALLLLWLLGGLVSLCGALSYAELAATLPRSGGEYHFLSRIYGRRIGELAGLVSATVGFAAPMALAAMAFGQYAGTVVDVPAMPLALAAVTLISLVQGFDVAWGRHFQVAATLMKVLLILVFCGLGFAAAPADGALSPWPGSETLDAVLSAPFALSFLYVSYAYSGWNAASYVTGEVVDAQRSLPIALIGGTAIVTALYLVLNLVFLRTIPLDLLAGTIEVGAVSAEHILGPAAGKALSLLLSLLLVSTISAMAMAGPRVIEEMARDRPRLGLFCRRSRRGAPARAVALLAVIAVGFILTDSFSFVLGFAGFTLIFFSMLTVLGVIRLRRREPALSRPFRVPWYPVPPLLFALISALMLAVVAFDQPLIVLGGALTLILLWLILPRWSSDASGD